MKDFDTTKVPATMSTRGMFAAVLGAQNHGDTGTVEAMFHKSSKNSELFDGNFMIDDETSRMRICFMPKLGKNLATQEYVQPIILTMMTCMVRLCRVQLTLL